MSGTNSLQSTLLMQLMTAKICHDLATPIGAMSLGMEMLEDSSADASTRSLLIDSLNQAKQKLSIYRALLSVGPNSPSFVEIKDILSIYCKAHTIEISFDNLPFVEDGIACRLILGLMYMAAEALTRGGALKISLIPSTEAYLTIEVAGALVQLRPGYVETITQTIPIADITARTIFPYYLKLIAETLNQKILINQRSQQHLAIQLSNLA